MEYKKLLLVIDSLINGQFKQAREQQRGYQVKFSAIIRALHEAGFDMEQIIRFVAILERND